MLVVLTVDVALLYSVSRERVRGVPARCESLDAGTAQTLLLMPGYPDLLPCSLRFMELSFHVSDGLSSLQAFWEARGLPSSKEPLMFAGYSRAGHRHTVFVLWHRSHDNCADVYIGLDARPPSQVFRHRNAQEHKLRLSHFREFISYVRTLDIHAGIRARYGYPSEEGVKGVINLPNLRPLSASYEILDEKRAPAMNVTYERRKFGWRVIVEPRGRYPFPEGRNFFKQPYELGCSLATSFVRSPHEQSPKLP